jgi:hypothetical protein
MPDVFAAPRRFPTTGTELTDFLRLFFRRKKTLFSFHEVHCGSCQSVTAAARSSDAMPEK